jgi:hypothetical protein
MVASQSIGGANFADEELSFLSASQQYGGLPILATANRRRKRGHISIADSPNLQRVLHCWVFARGSVEIKCITAGKSVRCNRNGATADAHIGNLVSSRGLPGRRCGWGEASRCPARGRWAGRWRRVNDGRDRRWRSRRPSRWRDLLRCRTACARASPRRCGGGAGDAVEEFCVAVCEIGLRQRLRDGEARGDLERAQRHDAEGHAGGDGLDGKGRVEVADGEAEAAAIAAGDRGSAPKVGSFWRMVP